jgi:hypothetical protein
MTSFSGVINELTAPNYYAAEKLKSTIEWWTGKMGSGM